MNNKYYFWGPLLYHSHITNYKEILNDFKQGSNFNENLAGILKYQFSYDAAVFKQHTRSNFKSFFNFYETYYNRTLKSKECKIEACWINFMKQGEFNPPHIHTGAEFSCVLYLDVPAKLKEENKKYIGRDRSGPGGIQFTYGEDRNHNVSAINLFPNEGDFFIFPANLRHVVYPFKSECTRVSMSANINLV